ncbi:MAG TPA: sigma-70 family RNA polymerase sigma factor [Thermoanaerobaculia bacterium]|jgi:RNA polymerase sigma-70 factor (ECF subfamily)|nr:sigma-70 family RNA polymerase sigma factor [Thermoanaerobaculia bacterium]
MPGLPDASADVRPGGAAGLVPSDADLAARALTGSERAFHDLVRRYERPIFSLIVRMIHDATVAEDIAQETFLKAYRRLDTYDPTRKFSSWLFKIAHNATLDHLRRPSLDTLPLEAHGDDEAGFAAVLADEKTESPEAGVGRYDLARALDRGLRGLRADYSEVLLLRFRQGLSYQEIAEVTGQPLGTVKTNIHRARKELAASLSGLGWHLTD